LNNQYQHTLLLVNSEKEYEALLAINPTWVSCKIVLLSKGFGPDFLERYSKNVAYFDSFFNDEDRRFLCHENTRILHDWYINETEEDISRVMDCSLALAFAPSTEILLNTLVRYYYFIEKALKEYRCVYLDNTDDFFQIVSSYFEKTKSSSLEKVSAKRSERSFDIMNEKVRLDTSGRSRDLSPVFKSGNIFQLVILKLIIFYTRIWGVCKSKKRFFLFSAGKMEDYFYSRIRGGYQSDIEISIPLDRKIIKNIWAAIKTKTFFYYTTPFRLKLKPETNLLVKNLKDNLTSKDYILPWEIIVPAFEKRIFCYFEEAYNFYLNLRDYYRALKPDGVVLFTENYETHNLAALAAKSLKIKTFLTSHGLNGWISSENKNGNFRLYDFMLAFGEKDTLDYKAKGVALDRIVVSSFPYFSNFLPINKSILKRERVKKRYSSALLLPPDLWNTSPSVRLDEAKRFLEKSVEILQELGIKVFGIKTRGDYWYKLSGIKGSMLLVGKTECNLLSGYSNLPQVLPFVDIIIGPPSTALIEAGLHGIDYYVYWDKNLFYTESLAGELNKFVNCALTVDEIKEKIQSGEPYMPGKSVLDLVHMTGFNQPNDVYRFFENALINQV